MFKQSMVSSFREAQSVAWEYEIGKNDQILEMLALLKTLKYPTQEELAEAMDISPAKLSGLKGQAIAEGFITKGKWKELMSLAREQKQELGRLQRMPSDY